MLSVLALSAPTVLKLVDLGQEHSWGHLCAPVCLQG